MVRAGIVGGTGYAGVELLRLLAQHPQVELEVITSRSEAGMRVDELFPNLRNSVDLKFTEPDTARLGQCDVVFFATPNGIAMQMARQLLQQGTRIIDLAADFRLQDVELWQQWYGMEHASPELISEAVYGLPELNRSQIATAVLVANPGCYPTAILLGLLPLVETRLINLERIIADAKSGVSGAGRGASVGTLFSEVDGSFKAYAARGHRHLPEIRQMLESVAGEEIGLTFVPHLVPMVRGIHATLYAEMPDDSIDLQHMYAKRYANEPFVDLMPVGSHPETRSVRGSNFCRIALHRPQSGDIVVILSVIDNLTKGAAGQAVQNMNIMFGLDEKSGIDSLATLP
ncbi:N-acetyl-gamma-glutamyl-phosphate reductase [Ectothiorhodospiraceae bacterium BW-2]|nr:N-acetyl-gamma-glutamyl-phosphate reductase [Ectothiorhodospiraceae bacterium BW-2]